MVNNHFSLTRFLCILCILSICLVILPEVSYATSKVKTPAQVTLVSVKASKTDNTNKAIITVKWKKIKKDITSYELYQKKGSNNWKLAKTIDKGKTSIEISVKGGEKNEFKIRAVNKQTVDGKTIIKKGKFSKSMSIVAKKYTNPKISPKYLVKTNDIIVYFSGKFIDDTTYGNEVETKQLHLVTIIENNSEKDIRIYAKDIYINGWSVFGQWQYSSIQYVEKGKNAKLYLYCNLDNANLKTFADVKTIELKVIVEDFNNYSTILETDTLKFSVNR